MYTGFQYYGGTQYVYRTYPVPAKYVPVDLQCEKPPKIKFSQVAMFHVLGASLRHFEGSARSAVCPQGPCNGIQPLEAGPDQFWFLCRCQK